MRKNTIVILFFITGLFQSTTAQDLSKQIKEVFDESGIPGMAVSIFSTDSIFYTEAFGYADIAEKKPYTINTTHNIGSTSKTFIGVALMQLVEQGKIDLDKDINEYLPFKVFNPHFSNTPITLRQLATHTSSIKDRVLNYELRAYYSDDNVKGNRKGFPFENKVQFKRMLKNEALPLGDFLEKTLSKGGKFYSKKNFHKHEPGTKEVYSNIGAALAGYVIEVVTGMPYSDYVKQNILEPLEMNDTDWTANEETFAKRYMNGKAVPDYGLMTYPDGALISSMSDLRTYCQSMMSGFQGEDGLLTAESFKLMMSNQYDISPLKTSTATIKSQQGIFWDIYGTKENGDIGHNGSDPGILTFMYFHPETGIACLLTTNCNGKDEIEGIVKIWLLMIDYRNKGL